MGPVIIGAIVLHLCMKRDSRDRRWRFPNDMNASWFKEVTNELLEEEQKASSSKKNKKRFPCISVFLCFAFVLLIILILKSILIYEHVFCIKYLFSLLGDKE